MKSIFLCLLSCFLSVFALAQTETEPNNDYATANALGYNEALSGTVATATDPNDYFVSVTPYSGTLKVYVQATNTAAQYGYLNLYGYDRRKGSGNILNDYVRQGTNLGINPGTSITDTFTVYSRGADTLYLRLAASGSFSYQIRYEVVDTAPADPEPNDDFATATPIDPLQQVKGQVGYIFSGVNDKIDYFRTILPDAGTIKVYIKATNYRGTTSYLTLQGRDGRLTGPPSLSRYVGNDLSVANGETVYDTVYLYSQAKDTFYFSVQSSGGGWEYSFSYDVIDRPASDAEPNNAAEGATSIKAGQLVKGNVGYTLRGVIDGNDYYATRLPEDGTLRIIIKARNTNDQGRRLLFWAYNVGVNGFSINQYLKGGDLAPGATVIDTLYGYCRAVDSMVFRLNGQSFDYEFTYEMVDTSPNDAEPNNSYDAAFPFKKDSTYYGYVGYVTGLTSDANDYYRTVLPSKGKVRIYVEGINCRGSVARLQLFVTDRNKNLLANPFISDNGSVPAGATVRDTIELNCVSTDTLFLRFNPTGCWRYNFRVELVDLGLKAAFVHNDNSGLHEFINQSNNATSYLWDLGDGTTTTAVAPPLKKYKPGSYQVKLTVKGQTCDFTSADSVRFTVKGLDRFTPSSGGPGNILFTAYGGGFQAGMHVSLKKGNLVFKDSVSGLNQYGNIYTALIDMHSAPEGLYDVEIKSGDSTWLFPGAYQTVTGFDKLRSEVIGRSIIRRNTDNPYTVRIYNDGNTMAGLVEVAVLFPSYMKVELKTPLVSLIGPQLPTINLDTVPLFVKATTERGYPINGNIYTFYVAGIPGGGSRDLSFIVNSAIGKAPIYTWVMGPYSGSDYKPGADDCFNSKLKFAADLISDGIGVVPGLDCMWAGIRGAGSTLYSLFSWATGGSTGEAVAASALKTGAGLIKDCAGEASGGALLMAEVVTDFTVLASNIDVNVRQIDIDCPDEPENPKPKPVDVRASLDPNAKNGPSGYGAANYIIGSTKEMNYTIYFENQPTATLPAQEVIVKDTLDKAVFDLSSFRALSFSIDTNTYNLPLGAINYVQDVPYNNALNVRMSISLDTASGVITANLKAIDKATGAVPDDPLAGFLPPNVNSPEGEGNISFALDLKSGLADGTVIRNKASIVFDNNEAIITNEWMNTLDRNRPASQVLAAYQKNDSLIVVKATGTDPASGVKRYQLWVSENGAAFANKGTIGDTITYKGKLNQTYAFYVVAIDSVGNVEIKSPGAEATVTLSTPLAVELSSLTATRAGSRNRIDWTTLHEDAGDRFEVEKSSNGRQFVKLALLPAKGSASSYTVYDEAPAEGRNFYRLKTVEANGKASTSKVVSVYVLQDRSFVLEVSPNPVQQTLVVEMHGVVEGRGTVSLLNLTGVVLQQSTVTGNRLSLDMSRYPTGTYLLRYTDSKRSEVLKLTKQ